MIRKVRRSSSTLLFLPFIALAGILPAATPSAAPPALRISSEIPLSMPAFQWAADVRWASESSVYLGLGIDGAAEVNLDAAKLSPKEMIPGASKPGGFRSARRVAASSRFFVAAGPALALTWRHRDDPARVEHAFEGIQAIDVRENRLAILGVMRDEQREVGKDGAIAWTGSLDKNLGDLKPFFYDQAGPGARSMIRCFATPVGAIRFLDDGSLVVVPGVQPGVFLYDAQGKLTRTWDTASMGIDSDCASLSEEQANRMAARAFDRYVWINQRRIVDMLLPMKQGLGLVVRRVESGRTRWDLKILRHDGTVRAYRIPIEGEGEFFHLRGDERSGKIVLVLQESTFMGSGKERPTTPRLFVAQLSAD